MAIDAGLQTKSMSKITISEALKLGVKAFNAGKYAEADRHFSTVLKASPDHPDGNHNMGVLAVRVGKHEAAIPLFRKAIDINPSVEQYWLSYVRTLITLGRQKDARLIVNEAKNKRVSADILRNLNGLLSANAEQPKGAPPKDTIDQLLNLYNQGQFANAVGLAELLAKQYTKSMFIWNMLGAAAAQSGQLDKSICAFEKVIAVNPDSSLHHNIGIAYQTR